jgi:hypothetical protein
MYICQGTAMFALWVNSEILLASRLLARVLKEGVQFWYNDTSTVIWIKLGGGGGGGGWWENVPLENLRSLRYFMSVSVPSSFEIFQTDLALWVCAAMLLYLTTTFSFSQVHHQIDQNVKCIIMNELMNYIYIAHFSYGYVQVRFLQ